MRHVTGVYMMMCDEVKVNVNQTHEMKVHHAKVVLVEATKEPILDEMNNNIQVEK